MDNILTIDMEDWYHCFEPDPGKWKGYENRIEGPTRFLLDILDEAGSRATFFVLADVAGKNPRLIEEIEKRGHEVGTHGSTHRLVYSQTEEEFEEDVRSSIRLIEEIISGPVLSYRAPFFSITRESMWALKLLRDAGIRYDSSIYPVFNHKYGIPEAERKPHHIIEDLLEIPLSTWRAGFFNIPVAGGAYFRIIPYSLTRAMIKRLDRNGPVVFYLHPWELDPDQPRVRRFSGMGIRHYYKLDKTVKRFVDLISSFSFSSIRDIYGSAS